MIKKQTICHLPFSFNIIGFWFFLHNSIKCKTSARSIFSPVRRCREPYKLCHLSIISEFKHNKWQPPCHVFPCGVMPHSLRPCLAIAWCSTVLAYPWAPELSSSNQWVHIVSATYVVARPKKTADARPYTKKHIKKKNIYCIIGARDRKR